MNTTYLLQALRTVWQHGRWWVITSVLFHILLGLQPLAMLWLTKELINAVADLVMRDAGQEMRIWQLLFLQFAITVTAALLRRLQTYLDKLMEVNLNHDLQKKVSEKVTSVPLAYFELPRFYNHLSRVQSGVGNRFLSPVRTLFEMVETGISLLSFLGFLLTMHWSFLLISLLAAVPMLVMHAKFGQQRFWLLLHQTPKAREAGYMSQLIMDRQGAKEVRLFGLASYLIGRWSNTYRQNAGEALKLMRRQQGIDVLLEALTALFYMSAGGVMIWLMRTTKLQVGDFVSMGQAVAGAQSTINQLAMKMAGLYEESLFIRDFFQFIHFEEPALRRERSLDPDGEGRAFPMPLQQGITLENVSFQYPDTERPVLQQVSFHIQPGEKVAVVGENGSGKTTLVKCLMGLYPIQQGHIRFDGVDLERVEERDVYRNITVIFQDFMKYALTLRENITFGDIERGDDLDRLLAVAKESGADKLAAKLKDGYETPLGRFLFDGEDVSGGQWQKIALARALYRGGQIIVLDEPTAALDPQAEMDVFEQFGRLTAGKTAVFISHRMAAARMADRILVMKDGRVAESGTHEELLQLNGEYARMYRMQARWYQDDTEPREEALAWST